MDNNELINKNINVILPLSVEEIKFRSFMIDETVENKGNIQNNLIIYILYDIKS